MPEISYDISWLYFIALWVLDTWNEPENYLSTRTLLAHTHLDNIQHWLTAGRHWPSDGPLAYIILLWFDSAMMVVGFLDVYFQMMPGVLRVLTHADLPDGGVNSFVIWPNPFYPKPQEVCIQHWFSLTSDSDDSVCASFFSILDFDSHVSSLAFTSIRYSFP